MKAVKIIILILSIIAFTVASFVFLTGRGIERTITNEDFYHQVSQETDVAVHIWDNIQGNLSEGEANEELDEIFNEVFDDQWARDSFADMFDNIWAWIKGDRESDVVLDIAEEKQELDARINARFADVPEAELRHSGFSQQEISQLKSGNFQLPAGITTEIRLSEVMDEEVFEELERNREDFQEGYNNYRTWTPIILLLAALLILVGAGIFNGLKWLGGIMLFTGGSIVLALYASSGLLVAGLNSSFEGAAGSEAANNVISIFVSEFIPPSIIYAIAGLLLLLAGVIGGRVWRRHTENKAATVKARPSDNPEVNQNPQN